jgi:heme/copper-type cytochrome/quinol oxidase subunit 4
MESSGQLRTFSNVYIGLVSLTACSLLVAESGLFAAVLARHTAEAIIVVTAGAKISLVALYFMELRFSPKWLLGMMVGWTAALAIVLCAFVTLLSSPV